MVSYLSILSAKQSKGGETIVTNAYHRINRFAKKQFSDQEFITYSNPVLSPFDGAQDEFVSYLLFCNYHHHPW
jgi:hypothetical protein